MTLLPLLLATRAFVIVSPETADDRAPLVLSAHMDYSDIVRELIVYADETMDGGTWDGSAGSQGGGDATYCPFLPDLVCILLRHLPEPSVYAVVCSVLERSRNDPDAWFPLCRRDTQALAMAVGALCAQRWTKQRTNPIKADL